MKKSLVFVLLMAGVFLFNSTTYGATCAICLDPVEHVSSDDITRGLAGDTCLKSKHVITFHQCHSFCRGCIERALVIKLMCPCCRQPIPLNELNAWGINPKESHKLFTAVYNDNIDTVRLLLKATCSMHTKHNGTDSLLHVAAHRGHLAIVDLLITSGIAMDNKALYVAIYHGFNDVVDTLLAHGANINAIVTNNGDSLLHCAAYNGYLNVVTTLLARGAMVNTTNNTGDSPLHLAAQQGHWRIITKLLAHGADSARPNGAGQTAAVLARRNSHPIVAARLAWKRRVQERNQPAHPSTL